jgi:hypothetical protein
MDSSKCLIGYFKYAFCYGRAIFIINALQFKFGTSKRA